MPAAVLSRFRAAFRSQAPAQADTKAPRSEAAPLRLLQHRIYILPTRSGLAFAAVLGLMLLASINYGLTLGYAFTFLLAGMSLASILHSFRNLLRLSIQYGKAESSFPGGHVVFHLLIDNPDPRRRPALRLAAGGKDPGRQGETCFDLPPATCHEILLALPARQRGILPLGRTVIETRWPLGLLRAWSVFEPPMEALVYPAPEPHPPALPSGPFDAAAEQEALRDGNEDFTGFRTYQNTDSPRHLAWKVFARGGDIMTKQFSDTAGGDLYLDWYALGALPDEARLSRLAAWLLRAEQAGQHYALRIPGQTFPTGRGEAHLHQCLGALALYGSASRETTWATWAWR